MRRRCSADGAGFSFSSGSSRSTSWQTSDSGPICGSSSSAEAESGASAASEGISACTWCSFTTAPVRCSSVSSLGFSSRRQGHSVLVLASLFLSGRSGEGRLLGEVLDAILDCGEGVLREAASSCLLSGRNLLSPDRCCSTDFRFSAMLLLSSDTSPSSEAESVSE